MSISILENLSECALEAGIAASQHGSGAATTNRYKAPPKVSSSLTTLTCSVLFSQGCSICASTARSQA